MAATLTTFPHGRIPRRRFRLALYACFATVLGSAWVTFGPLEGNRLAASATLVLTGTATIWAASRARDLADPPSVLAVVLLPFFVVAPQVQLATHAFSQYHLERAGESFVGAAAMTLLYVVGFLVGERLAPRVSSARAASPPRLLNRRRTRSLVVLYLLAGASSWAAYFASMGGFASYLDNLQNKTQLASGLGYLYLAANLFQVGALIAALAETAGRPVLPKAWTWAVGIGAFALVLLAGSRSRAVMFLLVLALQSYLLGRRASPARWATIAVVGAAVIFATGQIRSLGTGRGAIFDRESVVEAVRAGEATRMDRLVADYGHFDRLSLVYEQVPDRIPPQWGKPLASVLLFPIPRSWYPGKPVGSGPLLANALRPGAWDLEAGWVSGVTPTIVGEFFLSFWWPGVLLGGVGIGWGATRLHRRYARRPAEAWNAAKYSLIAIFLVMAGTLGEFYGTVIAFAVYALPVYAGAAYARGGESLVRYGGLLANASRGRQ